MKMGEANKNRAAEYPWYDKRMVFVDEREGRASRGAEARFNTPQMIYQYLDRRIWKQAEAKKMASIIMAYTLQNKNKRNVMFVGPSGCGKTEIWRQLKELFPDRIEIVDGSNVTQDGWKGEQKWSTLFSSPVFKTNKHTILVIDEADKMIAPKTTSGGENTAWTIMAEGLKIMEGKKLVMGGRGEQGKYIVDTANVSLVFCGAFTDKAEEIAEDESGPSIGFFASTEKKESYAKPLDVNDILEFGAMPEFMGRIDRIINLENMTEDDFYNLVMKSEHGPVMHLEKEYGIKIHLRPESARRMIHEATKCKLGVRGVTGQLRKYLDEAIFEEFDKKEFTI